MAWGTPIIHAVGDVLTASDWNTSSNDISLLGGATGATVATSQTTTSASYVNLATVGPQVTVATGAHALVLLQASVLSGTANVPGLMSFSISGATTLAAADANALALATPSVIYSTQADAAIPVGWVTTLTAGNNTFNASYRSAVSGDTVTFANRSITVIPLP